MISLAIHGCCIGCVDKIEAILITENNSNSRDYDKEKLKMMKCLGLIIGSFTGYFLFTFVNFDQYSLDVNRYAFLGFIHFICGFFMLVLQLSIRVKIFTPTTLQESADQNKFNRTDSTALIYSSLQIQKIIDKSHLSIFVAMFISLILSLSRSIKDVALPILMIDRPDDYTSCKCTNTYDLNGVYFGFGVVSIADTLGLFCLYRLKNKIENRYQMFIPLILGFVGQSLMISDSNLPIYLLALGLSLQGFSISLGMSITGNFLFEIVGNDPPAYFTIIYLLLELLGSIIGPF